MRIPIVLFAILSNVCCGALWAEQVTCESKGSVCQVKSG
jgi:hypothetical protein